MPKYKKTYQYRLPFFLVLAIGNELLFWMFIWQVMRVFGVFVDHSAGETLTFLSPHFGWFFFSVPLLIGVFYWQMKRRNRLIDGVVTTKVLRTFLKPVSTRKSFWRFFFIRNAVIFTIFSLMQPVLGTKEVSGKVNGVELIFAVDVSNSMNTRDIVGGETRLTIAKRVMNQLINQSSSSHVGLLIFAGDAYPQLPLTADKDAAKMYIDEINTSFISNQGTNIAAALDESSRFFSKRNTKKVLVLITDGENHEGGLDDAYNKIKDKNIEVLTLGIGTVKGGIVPQNSNPNARSLKDDLGRSVISKVNEDMLNEISNRLNGEVKLTNEAFPNVSDFLTHINNSSGGNTVNLEFKVKENRYQWPLGFAILSILLLIFVESIPQTFRKSNDA